MKSPKVVAEVGCNHKGSMKIALESIRIAALCGADAVKFQKRDPKSLLSASQYNSPHPNPQNSYGKTYGEHREFLELDSSQHADLKSYCEELGILYSTSVWDLTSAKEIAALDPSFIKIPSASNQHYSMLGWLRDNYSGQIQISLGMTTKDEEDRVVAFFEKGGRARDIMLYACTSGYPVPFHDLCLYEILRLRKKFGDNLGGIGYSGHHLGIAADIAVLTLGVDWLERHFTLDRTWKGTDHAASLEPDGLRRLCRDVKNVASALKYKHDEILPIETPQRDKLKWLDTGVR